MPVGIAAAPVNNEKLELARGPDAVPSEGVLEEVVERLGVTGTGAADDGGAAEDGGAADDGGGRADSRGTEENGGRDGAWEAESARLLSGGVLLGDDEENDGTGEGAMSLD